MKITVQQLRYLLETAERGSINAAAKSLGISKSTLYEALSQVEDELGFSVLDRGKRGVSVTERGAKVMNAAERVVAEMDAFEREFCNHNTASSRLHVSMLPFGFGVNALMSVAEAHAHADIDFNIEVVQTPKMAYDINNGMRDIGLLLLSEGNEGALRKYLESGELEYHELFKAKMYAYVSRHHPLAGRKKLNPSDLVQYPMFYYEQYFYMNSLHATDMRKAFLAGNRQKVNDTLFASLRELTESIAETDGYAVWCNLTGKALSTEGTVAIPYESDTDMSLGYLVKKGTPIDGVLKEYIDELMKYA